MSNVFAVRVMSAFALMTISGLHAVKESKEKRARYTLHRAESVLPSVLMESLMVSRPIAKKRLHEEQDLAIKLASMNITVEKIQNSSSKMEVAPEKTEQHDE